MSRGRATASAIVETFARHVRDTPDREALWSRGERRRLSFAALAARAREWRERLAATHGVLDPEHAVALAAGNSSAFVELFLALRALGVAVVSIDAGLAPEVRRRVCRELGVPAILHRDLSARREVRGEAASVDVGDGVGLERLDDVDVTPVPPATALVKLTSGQTAASRGVCFDEESLLSGVRQIAAGMEIDASDRVLIAIPLSHSYGFDNGVLSLAVIGTPLVLEPEPLPRRLLAALSEGEATVFPAVPPLVRALARSDWPVDLPLRRVICAAGPLPAEAATAFRERAGRCVHQFYGSTETGGICFERAPEAPDANGTVGHPLPGVDVTLDADGRVVVRSAANTIAHWAARRLSESRDVLPGDTAEWTESGRLRLTGRTADFIKVGGRRVHLGELELALRRLDGVIDAAVVGVDDPIRGERAVAFVVCKRRELDLASLPKPLALRDVHHLAALPYTARGKLDRDRLRTLARETGA